MLARFSPLLTLFFGGILWAQSPEVSVFGAKGIVFPLIYSRMSSPYGMRRHPVFKRHMYHHGIDLAAPFFSHARTIYSGRVVFADNYMGYGNLVTVEHADGFVSLYGHLSDILVSVGEVVVTGQIIGLVGATGHATGPHLHFELRHNGRSVDPVEIFPSILADAEG